MDPSGKGFAQNTALGFLLRDPTIGPSLNVVCNGATVPKGSKVPHHRVYRVSILGIVKVVLGRYLMAEYLDPYGYVYKDSELERGL